MTPRAVSLAVIVACTMAIGACRSRAPQPAESKAAESKTASATTPPALKPIVLPDLSHASPAAQNQISQAYATLSQKPQNRTYPADAGAAYGQYGMLLMAAEYFDEAETALSDAETLAPGDMRWPYYLAHIYRMKGDAAKSVAAFERALKDKPDYAPTLVWLGNAYLDQGRTDEAAELFSKALALQPRMVAALFGRGRAALARRDYTAAIADLEDALAADPNATPVHYPLALAYRGAGEVEKAQHHLLPQGSGEVKPPDPVLDEKDAALESPMAYQLRGGRALDSGNWDAAADAFRRGLALDPDDAALRHKLGTALAMKGDIRGAAAEFQETVRRSPGYAKAHYSLALVMADAGNAAAAEREFTLALKSDPNYVEAHLQLAELLRHTGRPAAALPHFEAVLQLDPRVAEARFGAAAALVRLHRYADARDRLQDGLRINPEHPAFAIALARLLAAAPDDRVRDGQRALDLLRGVSPDAQKTLDWGVAMAMALAETGQFDAAINVQRQAVAFASQGGDQAMRAAFTANLQLFESHRACRQPWIDGEPIELVDRPQDASGARG